MVPRQAHNLKVPVQIRVPQPNMLKLFLYFIHLLVVPVAIFTAIYLPPFWFGILLGLYYITIRLMNGCPITIFQKKLNTLDKDSNFTQVFIKDVFGVEIDQKTTKRLLFLFMGFLLLISIFF